MARTPIPAALLVEHPTVSELTILDGGCAVARPRGQLIRSVKLARRDRFRAALQLTAAVALLAEFDLWPDRRAILNAVVDRVGDGLGVSFDGALLPLSVVIDRLGGGEGATERLRSVALERIAATVRLTPDDIDGPNDGPGIVFNGAIARQLHQLPLPLDHRTARSLWALRWDELPLPEEGVLQLWNVPREPTAVRLASALWSRCRRSGNEAWLLSDRTGGFELFGRRTDGGLGVAILVGPMSQESLTTLSRWSQREGCRAAAIGSFPHGWRAPAPPFDGRRLSRHIALAGMAPDRARRILDQRRSRFEPLERSDRDAVTDAVIRAVSPGSRAAEPAVRRSSEAQLASWLSLSPTGLPAKIVALHTGIAGSELDSARESLHVIDHDGSWRLPEVEPLEPDTRHLLIAGLVDVEQPMHLVHSALGTGDSSSVEAWARSELDRLRSVEVRDLLCVLAPGALGHQVQLLHAEACLSLLDLCGARRALEGVPDEIARAHRMWLEAVDHKPGTVRELPTDSDIDTYPRVAAETAAIVLYDANRRGLADRKKAAESVVRRALRKLSGEIRHRIDLEVGFALQPADLITPKHEPDPALRSPQLRAQLAHRRAMVWLDVGKTGNARRLLDLLSKRLIGPGLLGYLEVDRGAVALQDGRTRDASAHQLRAHRLMTAAGFEHLTNVVLFDLAVSDIDQLRVRSAGNRLRTLAATDPADPFIVGEQARLALAVGDFRLFRRSLEDFEHRVREDDPRFAEGLALLRGVAALLDGDVPRAEKHLQNAGTEGIAWSAVAAADAGRSANRLDPDEWGITRAAALLHALRRGRSIDLRSTVDPRSPSVCLAIALTERIAGIRLTLDAGFRATAIRTLRTTGLVGWAEHMSGLREHAAGLMTALTRVVESGGVDGVGAASLDLLMNSLGITGIEVVDTAERTSIWRFGSGRPGREIQNGRLTIRPLGGDLADDPPSRLTLSVLEMVLPQATMQRDAGVEETGFIGVSRAARTLRRELIELGPSHLPILLVGETGVGKEVAARALHRLSGRRGALVTVNVAAIPDTLLEAELFGSVKGAYTGADRSRRGLAVAADGGTLFLDEVGDLDANLQVKLLRFLESGEVRAVGAADSQTVDVRIISATHADLEQRMREGDFRRDLFFRIAAPEVKVAPLRNRREDVPLLKDHFEREAVSRHGLSRPVWSPEADAALQSYHWPGNVRELRQVIEVAMVRAAGGVVRSDHLPISTPDFVPSGTGTWEQAQRDFRKRFLMAALERHRGNRSATARELGISRQALLYHLRSLGLNRGSGE